MNEAVVIVALVIVALVSAALSLLAWYRASRSRPVEEEPDPQLDSGDQNV